MIELEKKRLLSKEEYEYLLKYFFKNDYLKGQSITKQTNYYFDTDNQAMNKQNITCRIRLKNSQYKGTMKAHTRNSDSSTEIAIEVRNGIKDNSFVDMGLKYQGALVTTRCILIQNPLCTVVLDKNEYLGCTDYELEIEYPPKHEKIAESTMEVLHDVLMQKKCSLSYKESIKNSTKPLSKSERFFKKKAPTKDTPAKMANTTPSTAPSAYDSLAKCEYDNYNPDDYMDEYFYHYEFDERDCMSCDL